MFLCVLLCKAGTESSLTCRPVIISRLVTRLTSASINISSFLGEADKKGHRNTRVLWHVVSCLRSWKASAIGCYGVQTTTSPQCDAYLWWGEGDGLAASGKVQRERHM